MWRFKASKYKNAAPKIPKKEEWITSISASNLLNSSGNHIQASNKYVVFNTDNAGGSTLGVLPINATGRRDPGSIPSIQAHSANVTDFHFSPHDDYLLASGSLDCCVKIWSLPEEMPDDLCEPVSTLTFGDRRIENVLWHPLASDVLAVTSANSLSIMDVSKEAEIYEFAEHKDLVQCMSWKLDGSLLVTSSKDKKLRVIDPRANEVAQEANGFGNTRDSRVLWLGEKDTILSTGFNMMRQREIALRDIRNFSTTLKTLSSDTASGVLMPFYDPDTSMLFCAGKGDTCIQYYEVTDADPYLTQNSQDTMEQIKGLALVPKRSMDVMECEVDRLMLMTKNCIIPISYCVPRKNYSDFHPDLFPETYDGKPTMTADSWWSGDNSPGNKMSLDPTNSSSSHTKPSPSPRQSTHSDASVSQRSPAASYEESQGASSKNDTSLDSAAPSEDSAAQSTPSKRESAAVKFSGVRQSKFRHLEGSSLHKSLHISNLRNLSKNVPGESDAFHVNSKFAAVPLGGPGGLIAILKLSDAGRLPDTGVSAVQNGSSISDFAFDPFDEHKLVVGCEDAKIRIWIIPPEGLNETLRESDSYLSGHNEKIYFIRFHPMAKDILASASYDMTIKIWDLDTETEVLQLDGHTDTIFCLSWSVSGIECATGCKDGVLRVYDPRQSSTPIREKQGTEGTRGARIVWACQDQYLVVSGFSSVSRQALLVCNASDLTTLYSVDLETNPTILVPFYDEDSSTIFLTGRGDSTVKAFEVSTEYPHLFPLSDHRAEGLHQAISFLPKNQVDVRKVEFAKGYRLTNGGIEPLSFTVPRKRAEFFQDDLFPETKVTWEPTMTAEQWLDGENIPQKVISLKPSDMVPLSEAPEEAPKERKFISYDEYRETYKSDEQKKEELLAAMTNKMELKETPLPQDLTEGCDDDEWDDY